MNRRILKGLAFALAVVLGLNLPAWAQPGVRSRWTVAAGSQSFVAFNYGATASDTTGSTNARAIQAALTAANSAGGGVVVIDRPGIYLVDASIKADTSTVNYTLNSALVIYSNTTLVLADGVTVKLADASNVYTLRNSGGGNTAAGGTTTANVNIAVVGGKWDFNYANQTNDPRGNMYWKLHGMWFDYVTGLTMDGVELVGGKKFVVWQTNCTLVRQSRVYVHATNSDGIHTGGGCTDVVIRDSRFICPDNATPVITNEGGYYPAIGGGNVYLDAPHGPTSRVSFLNNQYPGCAIAPLRFAGGTTTLGTDNIEDVLVDGCTGDTLSASAVEIIDDPAVSPAISGAITRNLTIRNCRFVANNTSSSYTGGQFIYVNANGFKDLTVDGCTSPDLGFGLKGLTTGGGSNATAFVVGELVTESGTGAKGYFRVEDSTNHVVYVDPLPGGTAFTGASTPTYTGATSGAVRYNSTSTAPTAVGQNFIQLGARTTAGEKITFTGNVDKKAYTGSIYLNSSSVLASLVASGNTTTLSTSGRFLQLEGGGAASTLSSYSITGNTIVGPSADGSSAVVRLGASSVATNGTVSGNTITGVQNLFDASNTTLANINFSGNVLTGYGSNKCYILLNRSTSAIVYIGGDGNQYTDWNNSSGGWHNNGVNTFAVSPGYTRIRNLSLYIDGRAVQSAAMPSSNEMRGDCFFNTGGTNNGGVTWSTMYGKVHQKGGTWTFW